MLSHLLDMLDDDEQRQVLATARRRRFKRNEVVFHDGDPRGHAAYGRQRTFCDSNHDTDG